MEAWKFDYEEMSKLAKDYPKRFKMRCERIKKEFIASAPKEEKNNLRELQSRLKKAKKNLSDEKWEERVSKSQKMKKDSTYSEIAEFISRQPIECQVALRCVQMRIFNKLNPIDHEGMSKLAKENPEKFQESSERLINNHIASAPKGKKRSIKEYQSNLEKSKKSFSAKKWNELVSKFQEMEESSAYLEIAEYISSISVEYQVILLRYQIDIFNKLNQIDHEEWARLKKENPEEFEKKRKNVIEAFIIFNSEDRERAKKFQWTIDAIRKKSKNPLQSLGRMMELLYKKTYGDGGLIKLIKQLHASTKETTHLSKKLNVTVQSSAQIEQKKKSHLSKKLDVTVQGGAQIEQKKKSHLKLLKK